MLFPLIRNRAFLGWKKGYGTFVFLISGLYGSAQENYNAAIGSTYAHLNELPLFRNCIILESRVNDCNLVCRKVADTLNRRLILVAEQILDVEDDRKLLDVLEIWADDPQYRILIGSLETKEGMKTSAFLIAVESDTAKLGASGVLPAMADKSVHIFEAWQLNCRQKKVSKISNKESLPDS